MQLVKWEPFREMEDFMERFVKPIGWEKKFGRELATAGDWSPRVDISETDKTFTIKAEIPEIDKKDVKVSVENNVLTLQGERKKEKEEKNKKYHRIERYYGSFCRSFSLPENVDAGKIDATFKDGVLELSIPKTETKKSKSIEVAIK